MKKRIFIILLVLLLLLVSCKELNTKYINDSPEISTSLLITQKDNIQVYRFLDVLNGQGIIIVCYFTVNTISKNAPSMIACH